MSEQEARITADEVVAAAAQVYAVGRNRDEAARRLVADPKFRAMLAEAFRWAADRCPCTNEDGGTRDGVWFEDQLRGLADAIEVPR
jgi:hypothetical protein